MPTTAHPSLAPPSAAERKGAKPWRVLMMANGLAADNGPDRSARQLALRLRSRQWQVSMATVYEPGEAVEALRNAGVKSETLKITHSDEYLRTIARLARLIARERPHILHCHATHATLASRAARLLRRVPVVISTLHAWEMGNATGGGRWTRELLTRLTEPLSDATTVACPEAAEQVAASRRVVVIPSGVDLQEFRTDREVRRQMRAALQLGSAFVWLSASRFHPAKDHHTLVRAFAHVVSRCPHSTLLLAGSGEMVGEVRELVQSLRIDPHVRFLGARSDLPDLMNAADAYVLSSRSEALPSVLLEAGASYLPVVTTDVGGTRGVVQHGVTGFAAPPANPEALGSTMLSLMALSDEQRQKCARRAFLHVSRYHDLENVTSEWEHLYTDLLEQKGVRP